MPKLGMEPVRRDALVKAAIACIGDAGTLDVTVGQIAKRAGMSPALAHHYFGGKTDIFLAAMRHILRDYAAQARRRLARATTPRARLDAIIEASFAAPNFQPDVISAWLNFYVQAQTNPEAVRLLTLYHARLRSNLIHALRPLTPRPDVMAQDIAALIDGLYIRASLGNDTDPQATLQRFIASQLGAA